MIRWWRLYLKSRRVPVALVVAAGAIATVWGCWLAFADSRDIPAGLTVLTGTVALVALVPTLSGDDDAFESTAALPWRPRRAAHLMACFVLVAGALVASRATGAWFGEAGSLIRVCAGQTGLIGLGVALFGARTAWLLPVGWMGLQTLLPSPADPVWNGILFWLMQPADSPAATITALVLFLGGLGAYTLRPGPRTAPAEAALAQ